MNLGLLIMALCVGLVTWGFRFGPTRLDLSSLPTDGWLARFLASTGPAAIATLFVASILPIVHGLGGQNLPLSFGIASVLVIYALARSVVMATLAGSFAYGVVFWIVARLGLL